MKYTEEFDIYTFEFWAGAKETIEQVEKLGLMDELQTLIIDLLPDSPSATDINDFVWFEDEIIGDYLGVNLYED